MMGMSAEPGGRTNDGPDEGEVLNLDEAEHEPTGDPLVDRGMQLDAADFDDVAADPNHPDHEAAKAAAAHIAQQFGGFVTSAVSEPMRRIAENLAVAASPNLKNFYLTAEGRAFIPPALSPIAGSTERVAALDLADFVINETPQQTLEAILEVAERMSEAVRVAAEHRDVAIQQMHLAEREAVTARNSERRMLWLAWAAVIGTWLALIGTWVAVAR